jgi:hypothetical protein
MSTQGHAHVLVVACCSGLSHPSPAALRACPSTSLDAVRQSKRVHDERITAGRFARFALESTVSPRLQAPWRKFFCTSCVTCLTHRLDELFGRVRRVQETIFTAAAQKSEASKPLMLSVFSKSLKNSRTRIVRSHRVACRARESRSARRKIWCRCAREHASLCENTGFFIAL